MIKSSAKKGSTEGTVSSKNSVIELQNLVENIEHHNDDLGSQTSNHQFNLRDRKKISYNKKYGEFVVFD